MRSLFGVVLSNELFDALPVHRLVWSGDCWRELWVVERDGELNFEEGPLSSSELAEALEAGGVRARPGQVVDWAPGATAVMREIGRALERGVVLTIDYGGRGDELYGPHRMAGTALAYREHRAADDLLARPGEQDLTAHV